MPSAQWLTADIFETLDWAKVIQTGNVKIE